MKTPGERSILPLLGLVCVTGCHSFAQKRMEILVRNGDTYETTMVHVWFSDQGMIDGPWAWRVLVAVGSYPANVMMGILAGASAPFVADYDIEWGPIGWVIGTFVPGFTTVSSMLPYGLGEIHTMPSEMYGSFMVLAHQGSMLEAYDRYVHYYPWPGGRSNVLSVSCPRSDK